MSVFCPHKTHHFTENEISLFTQCWNDSRNYAKLFYNYRDFQRFYNIQEVFQSLVIAAFKVKSPMGSWGGVVLNGRLEPLTQVLTDFRIENDNLARSQVITLA